MNETIPDWDDYRLFLAIARAGGLAGAAAATGRSAPTLGRRMEALEKHLGRDLFRRHARGYDLTPQGAQLLSDLAEVEARLQPLAQAAARQVVKVSAGTWMTHVLCAHVDQIIGAGDVAVRFIAADHVLDIRHREAVIGIRNARPDQIGLAGRRLGRVEFAVYARDPTVAPWARVMGKTPSSQWLAQQPDAGSAIEVSHPRNALDLALAGAARAVLPMFIGDAAGGLQRLGPTIADLTHDQWLVTHEQDRFDPPVRRVIDRIASIIETLHAPPDG